MIIAETIFKEELPMHAAMRAIVYIAVAEDAISPAIIYLLAA